MNEPEKVGKCKGVVKLAEDGELVIVTSALTLTEVIWLKNCPKLTKDSEKIISQFFEQDFISVRTVDRVIAEHARQLVWEHNIKPKDSIHLATALQLCMSVFDTFDSSLIKLDGKLGNPRLRIGQPDVAYQEELGLAKETEAEEEDEDD